MYEILHGSFKDLGIVSAFGYLTDDKKEMIHNVQFSDGKIVALFYNRATEEWRIVD